MTSAAPSVGPGRPLRPSDPTDLGPYKLLRRLGEGGMGSVYLGKREDKGPLVAVKMIRKDLSSDPDFRRRFRGEVARAQQVPAFCTAEVLDADPDHEPPYLVVEFVNGPSLARVVQNSGPLSPANLHGLALGVATALTAIHGAGVVHRDLKPANVLLAPGAPKVIDFGIARAAEGTGSDTAPHQLIGTIPYMAPERLDPQHGSRVISPAADIFAWGAVVAYAGTGRVPFGGGSAEAAARILTQPPDLSGLTGTLRDLVELALSKDPKDRPAARELLDRLVAGGPRETRQGLIEAATEQAVVEVSNVSEATRIASPPTPLPSAASEDDPPSLIENALNATQPERRERKPGWATVPLLMVAVLLLTATVVGILTGLIKPFDSLASDPVLPSQTEPALSAPTPSPSTSVSPSASPTASPTPGPTWPPVFPDGGALLLSDLLTDPGPVFEDKDELATLQSSCKHNNSGYLVSSTHLTSNYRCGNKMASDMTDIAVEVEVILGNSESCAAIWFRYEVQGYLLSICPKGYAMYRHHEDAQELVKSFDATVKVKEAFTIGIVMRGEQMQFFHNRRFLFSAKDSIYLKGKVSLGIGRPIVEKDPRPREVLYRKIRITALPSNQP